MESVTAGGILGAPGDFVNYLLYKRCARSCVDNRADSPVDCLAGCKLASQKPLEAANHAFSILVAGYDISNSEATMDPENNVKDRVADQIAQKAIERCHHECGKNGESCRAGCDAFWSSLCQARS
jgi:hypothetical protein